MNRTKRTLVFLVSLILVSSMALANGLNLNGIGARAAAMGGAFVGLADDYTAVYWNPAGLAFLNQKTFGLGGDAILPFAKYNMFDMFDMKSKSKVYPAGIAGYFHPINEQLVVGVGAYTPSGLGAAWSSTGYEQVAMAVGYPDAVILNDPVESYRWESFLGAVTIAPTVAFRISDMVSIGASLNINYGIFNLWQWGGLAEYADPYYFNLGQQTLKLKGWGFGATFGLLVKPSEKFSFGATFRTPSKIKLSGTTTIEHLDDLAAPTSSDTDLEVTYPMWIAGGIAFKPIPELTFTFDAQYTNWKKLDELTPTFQDPVWNLLPGFAEEATFDLRWEDKIQWRGGVEYVFGNFAVRGGYYYDPTPTPGSTLTILIPGFDFNNITFGFGYHKDGFGLDLAFEYLMGKDRTVNLGEGVMPGIYEMYIFVPQVSITYGW